MTITFLSSNTRRLSTSTLTAAGAGYSPRRISGLLAWYDAADSSSVTLNGSTVSQINDKSGNNRNATQATAANQPSYQSAVKNSCNVLRFDGTNDQLSVTVPLSSGLSLFYVGTPASNNDTYIFSGSASGGSPAFLSRYTNGASRRDYEWWANNGGDRVILATTQSGFSIVNVTHADGGSMFGYINGTQVGTKASATATLSGVNLSIFGSAGGAAYASCDIGEVIVYSRVLSADERSAINKYLGSKWGITIA